MFCPNCGGPNDDGLRFCMHCGASLSTDGTADPVKMHPTGTTGGETGYPGSPAPFSSPGPAPFNPGTDSGSPEPAGRAIIRSVASSQLFLTAAISFTACIILSILTSSSSTSQALFNIANMYDSVGGGMGDLSDSLRQAGYYAGGSSLVLSLIISIPGILTAVAVWLIYSASRKDPHEQFNTSGLTILKVLSIIQFVLFCIFAVLSILGTAISIFALLSMASSSERGSVIGYAVGGLVVFVLIMILPFLYFKKLVSMTGSAQRMALTGTVESKASSFVAVFVMLGAFAYLGSIITGSPLGKLSGLAGAIASVCFSLVIFRLRKTIEEANAGTFVPSGNSDSVPIPVPAPAPGPSSISDETVLFSDDQDVPGNTPPDRNYYTVDSFATDIQPPAWNNNNNNYAGFPSFMDDVREKPDFSSDTVNYIPDNRQAFSPLSDPMDSFPPYGNAQEDPAPPVVKKRRQGSLAPQVPEPDYEAERLEQERQAREHAEQERIAREKAEAERLEQERIAREKAEAERLARVRAEQEQLARERAEQKRLARERAEFERQRLEQERLDQERIEREKAEQERLEQERIAREKAEAERLEQERIAREKAEAERLEQERIAREKAEAERLEQERIAREKAERERREQERIAREKAEAERLARERAEQERLARERAEAERQRLEQERIAREKAEAERLEQERIAREKAEAERLARERAEQERIARERAEAERQRLEQERIAREKAEAERLARERAEQERIAREAISPIKVGQGSLAHDNVVSDLPGQAGPHSYPDNPNAMPSRTSVLETTLLNRKAELFRHRNGNRILIDRDYLRIGRNPRDVDYYISDNPTIGRHHADIILRNGKYYIIDCNSTNHVYLNGIMLTPGVETPLPEQAEIRLSDEDFSFRLLD